MSNHHSICALHRHDVTTTQSDDTLFDIGNISKIIISSFNTDATKMKYEERTSTSTPILSRSLDIGDADLPIPNVFQSTNHHTDVSAEDLSEQWFISLKQSKDTLKNTTQKFLRSALLPLSRCYRADRMFHMKT